MPSPSIPIIDDLPKCLWPLIWDNGMRTPTALGTIQL